MAPITIRNVRFSFCNLFQPRAPMNNPQGEPKYSVAILLPKTDVAAKAMIDQAIQEAANAALNGKWNGVAPVPIPHPIHDGDGVKQDGAPYGPECRGMWVFTASCGKDHPPFVVDQNVQPVIDPRLVYSGMWGNVSVSFFGYYAAGKKGVGCGLHGAQKVRDDTPLGNRITAEEAFGPVTAAPAAPEGYPQAAVPAGYPQAPAGYDPSGMPIQGI